MRLLKKLKEKTLPYISLFSIIINILQPFALVGFFGLNPSQVHANEATESAELAEPAPEPIVEVGLLATPSGTVEEITEEPEDTLPEPNPEQSPEGTSAQTPASVTTDKADYAPTDTVLITANDLTPSTIYTLRITSLDPPAVNFEAEVSSNENGSLFYAYQLDGIYRPDYSVEILLAGSVVISTTFTDSNVSLTLDQCKNGGISSPVNCDFEGPNTGWGKGNANKNNAHLVEGQSQAYRLEGANIPAGTDLTITYSFDYTKGGAIAQDFPTHYSNMGSTVVEPTAGTSFSGTPTSTFIYPLMTVVNGIPTGIATTTAMTKSLAAQTAFYSSFPAISTLSMWGGTITDISYGFDGSVANVGSSDTSVLVTITFDTVATGDILISMGGHISKISDYSPLPDTAINISGSPYHHNLLAASFTNVGQQDMQLAANAISPEGDIIIRKVTDPATEEIFFNFTSELGDFSLGHEQDKAFSGLEPSTYNVAEFVPPGWDLTSVICEGDADSGSIISATGVDIDLDDGEVITCTFTNTKKTGTIEVVKVVEPVDDSQWDIFIDNTQIDTLGDGESTGQLTYDIGAHLIIESGINENNYTSSYDCTLSTGESVTSGSGRTIYDLVLGYEQNITCTFTNTLNTGFLQGRKYNDDNMNGVMEQGEEFLGDWTINLYDADWILQDTKITGHTGNTGQYRFDDLAPGTYNTCEILKESWSQTGPNLEAYPVDYDNNPLYGGNAIAVPNASGTLGEGSTCWQSTINGNDLGWLGLGNIQRGTIKVEKYIDPSDSLAKFEFKTSYDDNFFLGHTGFNESGYLNPGNYSVEEIVPVLGWADPDTTCSSDSRADIDNMNIDLQPGENITCVFTNIKYSSISGYKYEDSDGILGGDITAVLGWDITLWLDDEQIASTSTDIDGYYSFQDLLPGNYIVKEIMDTGWTNVLGTSRELDISNLVAGEDSKDNDFLNTRFGSIQGRKYQDVNGNGDFDQAEKDEAGNPNRLDDWNITLYDTDWNVVLDPDSNQQIMFTGDDTTPAGNVSKGQYRFVNVYPDTYYVCETPQSNWIQTEPASGPQTNEGTYCHTVTVQSGQAVTGIQFGNFHEGYISGHKWSDLNGNGIWDSGEPALEGWRIWLDIPEGTDLYRTTTGSGYYSFGDLGSGNYVVYEENQLGWIQTAPDSDVFNITMTSNGAHSDKDFGNVELGSITVNKITNPEIYRQLFDFELGGDATGSAQITGGGSNTFNNLLPGTYDITELAPDGWYLDYAYCGDGQNYENGSEFILSAGEDKFCTFHNVKYGEVIVTKYDDEDGDGYWDKGENILSDWEMNLTKEEATQSATTQENGQAFFGELTPGDYELSEILKEKWTLTNISCDNEERGREDLDYDNNHGLQVYAGQTTYCKVGNQVDPVLTIEKSNNASGTKSPGDTVEFTITVELTGSNLNNVEVTDLPATGFAYQSGSWTANSSARGDISGLGEPTYVSPGSWILGDMVAGEIVTLTYLADISTDQDRGLYKDIAWAQGTKSLRRVIELTVLAIGQNSDYVDGNFVGTEVEIDFYESETVSANIEKEGDVLGASTLPATGANTTWTFLALALMALGGLFMTLGGKMRKGITTMLAIVFAVTLLSSTAGTTYAAVDVDSTLSVRVEQPKSPTRDDDWLLSFTVLDLDNDTPTVNCFVKKPSASNFISFDSPQVLDPGGDNGSCHVTSNEIGEEGAYEFYVSANSGSGEEKTDIVSVEYMNSNPAAPENYSKDHPSFCRWVIKFKTANDNKTVNVEIYSSTSTSFSADGGTRVGSISIGPDQDGEFVHDRAGQCDQEWFYVIRAFDSIGNGSDLVGDSVVINPTIVEETTTGETIQAIPVTGSILGSYDAEQDEATDTGDILGEEVEEGTGLISSAKDAIETATKGKNIWWTIFAILVAGLVSYGFYTRYKAKKDN